MSEDKPRPFDSIPGEAGVDINRSPSLLSGDQLRDRRDSIEAELELAFLSLSTSEIKNHERVTHEVLSPAFWVQLGKIEEVKLAEEYANIVEELERRKVD